ncbi:MAG: polymerase, partial [Chloroflexus sp.]|nr:polymerase [Chloroflexus sp.]
MAEAQFWSRWPWLVGAIAIGAGLAMMPPLLAASWLLGLVALGLATCDPVWPVALAVLSVPFQQLVALPGGLSVTQFCFVLVALSLLRNARQRWPQLGLPGIALAIFIWTLALAAALTPLSRSEGLKETLRWGTVLLIYVAAVWALQDPDHVQWRRAILFICLLAAPAITALIGIGQFLTGIGPASFAVEGGRVRAYGTIGQPNSFAGYLNQAWPLAVGMGLAVIETRHWQTYRFWLTLGAIILAGASLLGGLLASFSRGGWVGALIGAIVIGVALAARYGRRMVLRMITATLIAGIGGLLLLYSGVLPTAFSNRISSIIENLRPFDARG